MIQKKQAKRADDLGNQTARTHQYYNTERRTAMPGEGWRSFELKSVFNPYSPQERCFFFKTNEHIPKRGEIFYRKDKFGKRTYHYICIKIMDVVPMFGYRIVKLCFRMAKKSERLKEEK